MVIFMQKIQVIEQFDTHLSRLGEIADSFSGNAFYSPGPFINWLDSCIQLAQAHQIAFHTELSLLKADVLTYIPANGKIEPDTSRLAKKLKRRHVMECMEQALTCVKQYFQPTRSLLEESGALCRKLLAVCVPKGYITDPNMEISGLIKLIQTDAELMPALTNVIGTVGYDNTVILLARILDEVLPQGYNGG